MDAVFVFVLFKKSAIFSNLGHLIELENPEAVLFSCSICKDIYCINRAYILTSLSYVVVRAVCK